MDDGFRRWRRELYEKNPELGYMMVGIDRSSGKIIDLEIRGVPSDLVEKMLYMVEFARLIKDLVPELHKECLHFFLMQVPFRNLTNLELKESAVLRTHYGKDIMDIPFKFVEELEKVTKTVCFPQSYKLQKLLELLK